MPTTQIRNLRRGVPCAVPTFPPLREVNHFPTLLSYIFLHFSFAMFGPTMEKNERKKKEPHRMATKAGGGCTCALYYKQKKHNNNKQTNRNTPTRTKKNKANTKYIVLNASAYPLPAPRFLLRLGTFENKCARSAVLCFQESNNPTTTTTTTTTTTPPSPFIRPYPPPHSPSRLLSLLVLCRERKKGSGDTTHTCGFCFCCPVPPLPLPLPSALRFC